MKPHPAAEGATYNNFSQVPTLKDLFALTVYKTSLGRKRVHTRSQMKRPISCCRHAAKEPVKLEQYTL